MNNDDIDLVAFVKRAAERDASDTKSAEQLRYERAMIASFRPLLERALAPYLEDEEPKTDGRKKYNQDVKRFKTFCDAMHMPFRPAAPEVVCYFLLDAAEDRGASMETIKRLIAAISWAHQIGQVWDPTTDPLIGALLKFLAQRKKGQFLSSPKEEEFVSEQPAATNHVVTNAGSKAALEGADIQN